MASAFFVRFDCGNRRFTGGKSRFPQNGDGGKITANAAAELCGIALTGHQNKAVENRSGVFSQTNTIAKRRMNENQSLVNFQSSPFLHRCQALCPRHRSYHQNEAGKNCRMFFPASFFQSTDMKRVKSTRQHRPGPPEYLFTPRNADNEVFPLGTPGAPREAGD